ncbi:MAG: hypothetical protein AB7I27_15985 [Bacteriovoracaceae bacterium]
MKMTIIFLISLFSLNCFAGKLVCEAWFQESEKPLEKQRMDIISDTKIEKKFSTAFKGYVFEVNWHYELTSLYTHIKKNSEYILSTTARVPTENHPEAFTDLNLPNGPRLSVNCEVH